jgi:hypothetical protein
LRDNACIPLLRRVELSMATGPAEANEAVRMARRAKVRGAMREMKKGSRDKVTTTRPFEGIGAPGSREGS